MSLYLYGLIRHDQTIDFGPIGFEGARVRAIPAGFFAAVIGPPPTVEISPSPQSSPQWERRSKEVLVKRLLSHQATLEIIMKRFFVLPFKFGTAVKDEVELGEILKNGEAFLLSVEEKVKDSIEIDVMATWDVRSMLQEISEEDPEITACKKEIAHGQPDRTFVGMLLANALKRRADEWRQGITKSLQSRAESTSEHDLQSDQMILNSSFLIRHDKEKEFFQTLEDLDLFYEKKLQFKCVGPLPPYSFATITLQRFDPEEVQRSAEILGLNGKAELMFVKKIYKELSRQCHPDTDPNLPVEKFEELNRAYELIAGYCKDGPRSLETEVIEKSIQLKVMENLNHAT